MRHREQHNATIISYQSFTMVWEVCTSYENLITWPQWLRAYSKFPSLDSAPSFSRLRVSMRVSSVNPLSHFCLPKVEGMPQLHEGWLVKFYLVLAFGKKWHIILATFNLSPTKLISLSITQKRSGEFNALKSYILETYSNEITMYVLSSTELRKTLSAPTWNLLPNKQ